MFFNDMTGFGRPVSLHGNIGAFGQPLFNQGIAYGSHLGYQQAPCFGTQQNLAYGNQQIPYFGNQQGWAYGQVPYIANQQIPYFASQQIPAFGNQLGHLHALNIHGQPVINPFNWTAPLFTQQPVSSVFGTGWNANVGNPALGFNTTFASPYGRTCF